MSEIILTAVGDICLGDSPKCLGFGVKSKTLSSNTNFLFEKIKPYLSGDIIFGNLEGVLSEKGLKRNDFFSEQLRGHPSFVEGLKFAGFDVLNIANNHMMQHGVAPLQETIELLRLNNIQVLGQKSKPSFTQPIIIEKKGKLLGFLSYSFEKDRYSTKNKILYANTSNKKTIINDIKSLKKRTDWLILSVHWGVEFMDTPSPVTVALAKEFIDAGVDVILGHHPHVVQPIVHYNNAIICYSLGNFIFDMVWNADCLTGVIIKIKLRAFYPPAITIIPTKINNNYQPIKSSKKEKENFFSTLFISNEKINALEQFDIEKCNMSYYRHCIKKQKHDMWMSNLFFIKTLFTKTPLRFFSGKLAYFLSKFFPF